MCDTTTGPSRFHTGACRATRAVQQGAPRSGASMQGCTMAFIITQRTGCMYIDSARLTRARACWPSKFGPPALPPVSSGASIVARPSPTSPQAGASVHPPLHPGCRSTPTRRATRAARGEVLGLGFGEAARRERDAARWQGAAGTPGWKSGSPRGHSGPEYASTEIDALFSARPAKAWPRSRHT